MTDDPSSRVDELVDRVARLMGVAPAAIDPRQPLTTLGLDSLKAVELGTYLEQRFGLVLELERFFDGLTITDVAAELAVTPDAVPAPAPAEPAPTLQFSLFFFSSDALQRTGDRYRLFLDCARYADANGFTAVWSPERHFHPFGGLFPNPSVLGAAVATITDRIRIRAGSVVLPLHDPVRVAEEWSVVDNLSGGRVDIAFATGWNADDFVLAAGNFPDRERVLLDGVATVQDLWRGGTFRRANGRGVETEARVLPPPIQPELPTWITCSGGVERFRQAGALGANVITALLFQDIDELAAKIEAYRQARAEAGHDPRAGHVTLMMHTFLGDDTAAVRAAVEAPFKRYLADSVDLWRRSSEALDSLGEPERAKLLDYAFERYFHTAALFGTPTGVTALVDKLTGVGVNEIACLVDFGVPDAAVLDGLRHLHDLKDTYRGRDDSLRAAMNDRHAQAYRNRGGVLRKAREFDLTRRLRADGLLPFYPELTRSEGATCLYEGRRLIMLGSNNYLGLTTDPRVREAAAQAVLRDGPSLTGSRLLNGTTSAHAELERRLAAFVGREDALVFTTGYQANVGLLSAVMGSGTTLVLDEECHASIYDGAAVGRCAVLQFRHNDTADLDRRLTEELGGRPAMVMIDGVYSMGGDLAPLREIQEICDRHGVPLAIDDAHGLGMIGASGRGIEEAAGVPGAADVLTGTLAKSLSSVGGWLAADRYLTEWIRYHGRSMLFSVSAPPAALAAATAALDILVAEPWRIARVHERADYWRNGLTALGFDVGRSASAIVPVIIGDDMSCLRFARELLTEGVYANCVVAPAVATDRALIRTSVLATHTEEHLDRALDAFATAGRRTGVLA